MTLQELFNVIADNPAYILFFFFILPFTAFVGGVMSKGEGHLPPWNYFYSTLIYLAAVPGIFAVTLNIYLFLFEKRSVMQTDVYTQILPIVSMIATLLIIRKNVNLDLIPGFDKLSGLITIVAAALGIMWFVDRTRIWMVSFVRFEYVLGIFVLLLILIRFGWSRMIGRGAKE